MVAFSATAVASGRTQDSMNLTIAKVSRVAGSQRERAGRVKKEATNAVASATAHSEPVASRICRQVFTVKNASAASAAAAKPVAAQAATSRSGLKSSSRPE